MTNKIHFTIEINAPKEKVWETMLGEDTYKEWVAAFHEGSTFEGSWDKGSKIRFVAEDNGKVGGLSAKVVENIPYEYISLEYVGEIVDGEEVTTGESAQQWIGGHENYSFSEKDGVTTVDVDMSDSRMSDEFVKMFEQMWPKALEKLKEIAEK